MRTAAVYRSPIPVRPGRRSSFAYRMGYPPAWRRTVARSGRWCLTLTPLALLLAGVVR
jgi:hypothetical protein